MIGSLSEALIGDDPANRQVRGARFLRSRHQLSGLLRLSLCSRRTSALDWYTAGGLVRIRLRRPAGFSSCFLGRGFFLGLLYCGIGRRFEPLTRLQAFSMTSPFSLLLGYVGLRFFRPDHLAFEYDQAAFWTVLVGWPILWHLAVLGARQASWRRATCIAVAYSLSLFSLVIVQAYRVYAF